LFRCPLVLRVVGCLPSGEDRRGTSEPRGQASYKPQGRKPRNGPVRLAQRRWLWGLLTLSRAEHRKVTGTSHSDVLPMPGEGMVMPDSLGVGAAGIGLIAAPGKAFRDPRWRTRNRCTAWRGSDALGHAGLCDGGGARIGWRRRNVSMMRITPPQHRQTNGGWTDLGSAAAASCGGPSASRAAHSSNARTRAKLVRRPALASNP